MSIPQPSTSLVKYPIVYPSLVPEAITVSPKPLQTSPMMSFSVSVEPTPLVSEEFKENLQKVKEFAEGHYQTLSDTVLDTIRQNPQEADFAVKMLAGMSLAGLLGAVYKEKHNKKMLAASATTGLCAAALHHITQPQTLERIKSAANSAYEWASQYHETSGSSDLYQRINDTVIDPLLTDGLNEVNNNPNTAISIAILSSAIMGGLVGVSFCGGSQNKVRNIAFATVFAAISLAALEGLTILEK